jgi:hypothetical protein
VKRPILVLARRSSKVDATNVESMVTKRKIATRKAKAIPPMEMAVVVVATTRSLEPSRASVTIAKRLGIKRQFAGHIWQTWQPIVERVPTGHSLGEVVMTAIEWDDSSVGSYGSAPPGLVAQSESFGSLPSLMVREEHSVACTTSSLPGLMDPQFYDSVQMRNKEVLQTVSLILLVVTLNLKLQLMTMISPSGWVYGSTLATRPARAMVHPTRAPTKALRTYSLKDQTYQTTTALTKPTDEPFRTGTMKR